MQDGFADSYHKEGPNSSFFILFAINSKGINVCFYGFHVARKLEEKKKTYFVLPRKNVGGFKIFCCLIFFFLFCEVDSIFFAALNNRYKLYRDVN